MAKKMKHLTAEELEQIDRGEHLFMQLNQGTQACTPEVASQIEAVRGGLYDILGRLSDYYYDPEDEASLKYLISLQRYAYHWRMVLAIHFGELKGHKVADKHRDYWLGSLEKEPFKSLLEAFAPEQPGESVSVH